MRAFCRPFSAIFSPEHAAFAPGDLGETRSGLLQKSPLAEGGTPECVKS